MQRTPGKLQPERRGSSYLEVQVAMVLLSIGISGLYSISVVQTRQTARLQQMLPSDQIASINPVSAADPAQAAWAKKFGVYAEIQTDVLAAPVPIYPLNHGFQQIIDNEDAVGFITYQAPGADDWEEYGGHYGDHDMNVAEISTVSSYGSYAYFEFRNVPPGEYEVFTTFPTKRSSYSGEFGSAVPHYIIGGSTYEVVPVDQRTVEQDVEHDGHWWERLGKFTFDSNTVYVVVYDSPRTGDWLIADAVMLRSRRSFEVVTAVSPTADGGATVTVELD